MNLSNKKIVITGGTSGIGFGLAKKFLDKGNEVLAVGFNQENIERALKEEPRLKVLNADLSKAEARINFVRELEDKFSEYNVIINNAGIQRQFSLMNADRDWDFYKAELAINFEAPLHLTLLMLNHLVKQKEAAIINVSSGLVINPGAWVPFYTSAKNGLHGFTEVLRLQLQDTPVYVAEIFPPAVDTGLGNTGDHSYGATVEDFVSSVVLQLEESRPYIVFGSSKTQFEATKEENRKQTLTNWEHFKDKL